MSEEEDRLKEIAKRGEEAKEWLNHPLFKHVISLRKAHLFNEYQKTKYNQAELREEIYRKLQALNAVEADFRRMIRNGGMANEKLIDRIKNKFKRNDP